MKNVILVILYNKKIEDSVTLKSLLKVDLTDYFLIIYNNGPYALCKDQLYFDLEDNTGEIELVNDLNNKPLSMIYNSVINKSENAENIIIFDDDSSIPNDFFIFPLWEQVDLMIPMIKSTTSNEIFYPISNYSIITMPKEIRNEEFIISIGSGLIINKKIREKFKTHGIDLFDEQFSLYGVDFSFFRRIQQLKNKGEIINIRIHSYLIHSLSKLELKQEKWRENERLHDAILSAIHYKTGYKKYGALAKYILRYLIKLDFSSLKLIINDLKYKSHPNCLKFIK